MTEFTDYPAELADADAIEAFAAASDALGEVYADIPIIEMKRRVLSAVKAARATIKERHAAACARDEKRYHFSYLDALAIAASALFAGLTHSGFREVPPISRGGDWIGAFANVSSALTALSDVSILLEDEVNCWGEEHTDTATEMLGEPYQP